MSYILDALRISDQQRQRGTTPTLRAAPATVVAVKQPASVFYILLAVVLLCGGIAIGWLRPWQPAAPVPVPESGPIATTPPASEARQGVSAPQPDLPLAVAKAEADGPAQKPVPSEPTVRAPVALLEDKPPLRQMPLTKPVVAPAQESVEPLAEKPATPAVPDAAPDQRVRTMAELPASIRQEMPKISISGHVYAAEAEGRLVGINDQLMREGDSPAPGLKLEEITPDGMIFSYRKYRFRRDAQ